MSGDHNQYQKSKSYLDNFECPGVSMKPKFMRLLEQCILSGVILGHDRAYKHNPAPERYQINQSICNEVMNEICDWFDFYEGQA